MEFKVIFIGSTTTGKSALWTRFCYGYFSSCDGDLTIDNEDSHPVNIDGMEITLHLMELGGLHAHHPLRPLFYPRTNGIVIAFDITKPSTFEDVAGIWLDETKKIEQCSGNAVKLLIGNKCDMISECKVSYEKAQKFANENGMLYIETSAKTGYNVKEAFELITRNMIFKQDNRKLLQKSLDKAKKQHNTIPVRFIKLFFTGSGAAGKTSFMNLLLKKKFVEQHHSTNVIHTNHAISVKLATFHGSSDDKVEWVDLDSNLELSYLRSVLLPVDKSPKTDTSPVTEPTNFFGDFSQSITPPKAARRKAVSPPGQRPSIKDWLTKHLATSVKGSSLLTFDSIFLSSNSSPVSHQPGEVLNIITLVDTGGQPEYIHLLPTINIYPTVTFVIHDLSKSLSDQVLVEYSQHGKRMFAPYHLSYSNLDMIKLLMSAANDSIDRPTTDIPKMVTTPGTNNDSYICLVGTHADQVSQQRVREVEYELNTLVHVTGCETAVWQNINGNVLFSVNNATAGHEKIEDPAAEVIRKRIESLSEEKEVYNLPITWMLLQLEIQQLCSKREKAYISYQDCVSLAKETGLISKEKEVKSVLLYHHLLGVLIYFDEIPGLCDYVIVDHQWWFDKLSNIISITFQQASLNHLAVQKLKYQGLLSKDLLHHVEWKDDIKEEFFLSLLIHKRIIAPVTAQEEYFIPYILPTYNLQKSHEILNQYGNLQGEPLLIQFHSGFLPRGLFCSLIVEILQHSPKGWEPHISHDKTHHTFSNIITFILPNGYFLSLLDKVSYLELQIRCLDNALSSPVHVEVYNYLVYALTEVCIHLNFDYERLQYGFVCQCNKKPDHHFAIANLPTMYSEFLCARCTVNNIRQFKMESSQLIWFYLEQSLINKKDDQSKLSPYADVKLDPLAIAEDNPNPLASTLKRPAMRLLHEIVVPRIAADWSMVADYLEYEVEYKRVIKERCQNDPEKCCVELLEDWLTSNRGVSPKSWSRLIDTLKGIRNLTASTEKIIKDLRKAGVIISEF